MKLTPLLVAVLGAAACGDNIPYNHPPTVAAPTIQVAVDEDGAADFSVAASDPGGDRLTYWISQQPAHGVVPGLGPSFRYVPTPDYAGEDRLHVVVSDGVYEEEVTVQITVAEVPDAPVAADDAFAVEEDMTLAMASSALVANDADVDSAELAVTAVGTADHGAAVLVGGDVRYTPPADWSGTAHFTYTVSDGALTSEATVTVEVGGANDAPVAVADAVTTAEDAAATIPLATLLANDTDVDGQTPMITAVAGASHGTVAIVGADVVYTPATNYAGADAFTYTLSDGTLTATGTVAVTVTAVDDPPVAGDDAVATSEDAAVVTPVATLLANDSDLDGTPAITAVTQGAHGAVVLAGGAITYTPAPDYAGADSFTYTVTADGQTDTATVAVTVAAVNDAPVAVADALATDEDTAVGVPVATLLANDGDVDGTPSFVSATQGAHGTVAVAAGTLTYTPAAGYSGADSFTYTITDGALTSTASVAVAIGAVNDAPVAVDDAITTDEDTATVVTAATLLGNDSDPDSTPSIASVTQPAHGTVALAGGSITYTPAADYAGADSFTYTITDGALTDTATVAVTVTAVNDAPVAVDDAITTDEDTAKVVAASALLANDGDPDSALAVTAVTQPAHGVVVLAGGSITYTPVADYAGPDSFTYTLDADGVTASATVAVTVAAVNDAPVAADDALTTAQDTAGRIAIATLLANDSDIEGTPSLASAGDGAHGTVAIDGTDVVYTPAAGYSGADSFSYTITDGELTATASVAVTVTPGGGGNQPPTAAAVSEIAQTGQGRVVLLRGTDPDTALEDLTFSVVTQPLHGVLTGTAPGLTYTSDVGYVGSDVFSYTVSDGTSTSALATVTLTVVNCGNGQQQPGEECEDSNDVSGDGCTALCQAEVCGDGIVQFGLGEQCDDGGTTSGDGCDATCQVEPFTTTPPIKISGDLTGCTTATANAARKIAVDSSGTVYAVVKCNGAAHVVTSTDRGQTYGAPRELAPSDIDNVAIGTGPSGVAYVALLRTTGEVSLRVTIDAGANWTAEETLGVSQNPGAGLSLRGFNDDVYVGYVGAGGVEVQANHQRGFGGFVATTAPIMIAYFDLLYDVVTETLVAASDTPDFHISTSTDGAVSWSAEVNPPGQQYYSDWATGNGVIYAVGTDLGPGMGSADRIHVIQTSNLGASTEVFGLPATTVFQARTVCADADGNAFVATTLDGNGVQLDRLGFGGTAFDAPRSISPTGYHPVATPLPGAGGAAVLFTEADGVYATVQAYAVTPD